MDKSTLIAWHAQSTEDVLDTVQGRPTGLTDKQVQERLLLHGKNTLPERKRTGGIRLFLSQFSNPFMLILLFAGLVSMYLQEYLDVTVIMIVVVLNVLLGFFEEYKADKSLQALQSYLPEESTVRRNGITLRVPAEEIVPGDVLLLHAGDKITADARMIKVMGCETYEAALTGESNAVHKHSDVVDAKAAVGDRANMVFAGTSVVRGSAEAVVIATGAKTQIGMITTLVADVKDEKTPLQLQLRAFARLLGFVVLVAAVIVLFIGLAKGVAFEEMFYLAVALAVAAVPEGLIVALTVVLAIGMQRILKRKALVRKLVAAETLGSVSVICMDKTGTLTTGEMQVVEIQTADGVQDILDESNALQSLRKAILAVNAVVEQHIDGKQRITGSPTDVALHAYVTSFPVPDLGESVAEIPFDSSYKYVAHSYKEAARQYLYVAGAPEVILQRADVSDTDRASWQKTIDSMATSGLRTILFAQKEHHLSHASLIDDMIEDVQIVGIVGLKDPPRKEASETVHRAKRAGLRPIMITGDHPNTAITIAREVGLDATHDKVLTGVALDELSDDALRKRVLQTAVYARVMPRHKLRVVHAWQSLGASVAMTGDGVNDAPAIKAADIGIALGSGTEVTKGTADIVLLDNNFATIISAIREGRILFDNMRKMIVYLLSDSFSEIVLVMGALLFSLPLPILPAQILWINLIADGLPSIALAFEPGEKGVMLEPPRKKQASIVNSEMILLIAVIGTVTSVMLFGIYLYLYNRGIPLEEIQTFIYIALGFDSLMYVFAVRTFRTSIFRSHPFKNPQLLGAVAVGLILLFLPMIIPPLRTLFGIVPLHPLEWGLLFGLSIIELILIELIKEVYNMNRNKALKH